MSGAETQDTILHLENVGVTYPGGVEALKPMNLELQKGEVTVLLGRSGAGKSTLLRSMNFLVRPTTGTIKTADGTELGSARSIREHRRKTGMVFQQHQLIGRQTSLTNVLAGRLSRYSTLRSLLPLSSADRIDALSCLDRVGLLEKALQRTDTLSGGQQQRVGVARALVMEPEILLADEPVASLDPATSHALLDLLREICRKDGITLVLSLHQVEYAREFGDRILALSDGVVVFDDDTKALTDDVLTDIYGGTSLEEPAEEDEPSEREVQVEGTAELASSA
ncbi:MAG: phosphonate ABC transporter ATP-binding protein [Verrucomicrobiota bacterium]